MTRFDFSFFDSGVRFDTPDANPNSRMRNLSRFLSNPFDDPGVSMAELIAFTTDHLQRMIANNSGGELTARITATTSSLALVEECLTDDMTKLGLRKSRKQAKDEFRRGIPRSVEKIVACAVAAYGGDSPTVLEFCPSGRTVFNTCRDDQMENHLDTLLVAVTDHAADLPASALTQATALKATGWRPTMPASNPPETRPRRRRNLLKLAEMYPRQPEELALYMQQHLLENPETPEEEEEEDPPPTDPEE